MDITLNKKSPIPLGVQVKEQVKIQINQGVYKEGDKLPAITQLAESLGVNKNTIVAALKDLEYEGYLESFRGKGVFVSGKKIETTISRDFINRLDSVIKRAKIMDMGVSELINLISVRFSQVYDDAKEKCDVSGMEKDLLGSLAKVKKEKAVSSKLVPHSYDETVTQTYNKPIDAKYGKSSHYFREEKKKTESFIASGKIKRTNSKSSKEITQR